MPGTDSGTKNGGAKNYRVRVPIDEIEDVAHFRELIGDPLSDEERRDLERLQKAKDEGVIWSRRTKQGIRHYTTKKDARVLLLRGNLASLLAENEE